ncbi:hypothetical protein GQ457_03G007300 [Hibiscus cannabinus]
MNSHQNPSVEKVACDNGIAVGFKGGRPPDDVVVVEGINALERSGSPVPGVVQPLQKRGRSLEEPMIIDDEPRNVASEVRGLDGGDPQLKGAATGLSESSIPSFKDKLVGDKVVSSNSRPLTDLDVDVREDDVRIGGSSTLPEIQFSDRVHNQVDAQLAKSVIVRLLGKSIGYRALLNRIQSMWNPKGDMCLIDQDNDYYLARFALVEDFQKVLSGGPWVIYGNYLTVQPWSRGFSTTEAHPSHIMVWVRLPKLPYRYYTKSMFRYIVNAIGKVVRVDSNTSEGKRGRFARLAIIVDLRKPLVSGIVIDGHRQDIEYEGLSEICFKCGRFGHSKEMCEGEKSDMSLKVAQGVQRDPTEPYGPWMQVVNRHRRPGTAVQLQNRDPRAGPSMAPGGSRFAVLEEDGDVLGAGADCLVRTDEQVVGAERSVREAPAGSRGRVRIGSAPSSPKVGMESRNTGSSDGVPVTQRDERDVGVISDGAPVVRVPAPVSVQGVVLPLKSALRSNKHAAVQVFGVGEGPNPKPVKSRVLPSSIRGTVPRGSVKKGVGNSVNSKLGIKHTKRDDRGQVNPVVHSSLAALVADLDRAGAAVKDSGLGASDESGGSDVQRQWRVNSIFEQPGLSDMQGALDPVVARSFKLLCRSKMPDIARGFSRGIWILWKGSVKLDILVVSNQFVHGHCFPLNGEPGFRITFIYASLEVGRRRSLWPQLRALEPEQGVLWILGGDLIVIGNSGERRGSLRRSRVCSLFGDFLFDTGLLDMGFHGPQFTWRWGNLFQRLDRCLCNKSWYDRFSVSEVFHLIKLGSDHRPIMLDSGVRHEVTGCKPFRYLAAWNEHEDFPKMLASSWLHDLPIHKNIRQFQQISRKWSIEVFVHIDHRKRQLLARLRGIECAMELGPNPYLEELENALKLDLDIVLIQEESLWHQRARNAWIDKGDRNTRFFYLSAVTRQKRNSIKSLKIDNQWCVDQSRLREHAIAGVCKARCERVM